MTAVGPLVALAAGASRGSCPEALYELPAQPGFSSGACVASLLRFGHDAGHDLGVSWGAGAIGGASQVYSACASARWLCRSSMGARVHHGRAMRHLWHAQHCLMQMGDQSVMIGM